MPGIIYGEFLEEAVPRAGTRECALVYDSATSREYFFYCFRPASARSSSLARVPLMIPPESAARVEG